jgi:site-specific DNA-cytosine methylase
MNDVYTKSRRAANDQDYETWKRGGVAPTLNAFDNATESRATVVDITPMGVRRLTPVECERLQGFPDGWTDGQSDSARYRQLGNAVTVPVAEWIGRRLIEAATDA